MSNDPFYTQGAEIRVGLMADAATDPTAWENLEYVSLSLSPGRDERDRPLMGVPLNNNLDDRETVAGLTRVSGEIVVPADTRQLARWLRLGYGLPATAAATPLFAHTWDSGVSTMRHFAIQVRMGAADIRVFRGMVLASLAMEAQGEQVDDFNVTLGLRGLREAKLTNWLAGTTTAVPAPAPVRRTVFTVDGVATARTMQSAFTYDRKIEDQIFLSQAAELAAVQAEGGMVSGSAQFRAVGLAYDTLESARTPFAASLLGYGKVANHKLELISPQALFAASPVAVDGPGQVERSWTWRGYQTSANPAARVRITNDVASYT
jgi:hypothetical protein